MIQYAFFKGKEILLKATVPIVEVKRAYQPANHKDEETRQLVVFTRDQMQKVFTCDPKIDDPNCSNN